MTSHPNTIRTVKIEDAKEYTEKQRFARMLTSSFDTVSVYPASIGYIVQVNRGTFLSNMYKRTWRLTLKKAFANQERVAATLAAKHEVAKITRVGFEG